MNKLALIFAAVTVSAVAHAGVYTFEPSDKDLGDLDHYYAQSWGIDWSVPSGQVITGATLTIKNIWDWTQENNDILYITLLDNPGTGIKSFYDNQGGGNYFGSKGPLVGTWTDPVGGVARNVDLSFDLKQLGLLDQLKSNAADGKFGFGFDADCHYYNDGVKLKITTESVPEPATMTGLALGALALVRKRMKKSS